MADDRRDRTKPPVPSSFFVGGDSENDEEKRARRIREEASRTNPHLDMSRIEGAMENSVARQMLKLLRENPDLAANLVRGLSKKG